MERAPVPWSRGMMSFQGRRVVLPTVTEEVESSTRTTMGMVWNQPPSSPAGSSPIRAASRAR